MYTATKNSIFPSSNEPKAWCKIAVRVKQVPHLSQYLWHGVGCSLVLTKFIQQTYKFKVCLIVVCSMKNSTDSFQKLLGKLCVCITSLQIVQQTTDLK